MTKLKQEYLQMIITDPELTGLIAKRINKSVATILRWANANDEKLTMLSVIQTLREYLKLPKSESLIEIEPVNA